MSEERDTRAAELQPGDRVRWLGEWFDVVKVAPGLGSEGPFVGVTIDDRGPDGRDRVLFYTAGWFVAADCPREPVPA